MGQSAARKKKSYSKHKILILVVNVFQEKEVFHKTMFFCSKLYLYNTQETYLFNASPGYSSRTVISSFSFNNNLSLFLLGQGFA